MFDPLSVTAPLAEYVITPHGGFAYVREGGVVHHGIDMRPKVPHDWCVAPELGTVTHVALDNSTPPLSRYGPGAVLLRGRRVWHVLGHLDPKTLVDVKPGRRFAPGERVGRVDVGPNHVHWEVRTVERPPVGAERARFVVNPITWLRERELAATFLVVAALVGAAFALSRWL